MRWVRIRRGGLAASKHGLTTHVVMSDVDGRCVQAQENAGQLGVTEHVKIRQGSLFAPMAGQKIDSVVFNLPPLYLDLDAAMDDANGRWHENSSVRWSIS